MSRFWRWVEGAKPGYKTSQRVFTNTQPRWTVGVCLGYGGFAAPTLTLTDMAFLRGLPRSSPEYLLFPSLPTDLWRGSCEVRP
jgi:hypothetical protein